MTLVKGWCADCSRWAVLSKVAPNKQLCAPCKHCAAWRIGSGA